MTNEDLTELWYDRATVTPDVFGRPAVAPQGQDGVPHFNYYDAERALGFVWDGNYDQHVLVSQGGDGEPIKWHFDFSEYRNIGVDPRFKNKPHISTTAPFLDAVWHFKNACDAWIERMEEEFRGGAVKEESFTYVFDEANNNWSCVAEANRLFLAGTQTHLNNRLQVRGHVFLNEVFDVLGMPRTRNGATKGWLLSGPGDDYVDFHITPLSEGAFSLQFNVNGDIHEKI